MTRNISVTMWERDWEKVGYNGPLMESLPMRVLWSRAQWRYVTYNGDNIMLCCTAVVKFVVFCTLVDQQRF